MPRRPFANRLHVETLEDRLVPTPYTVSNTDDSGAGSLRQAIIDANANAGYDEIRFNISGAGVQTINLASELPAVSDLVMIDGYTQPGAAPATAFGPALMRIVLDGSNAGAASGLVINTVSDPTDTLPDTAVRGLVINNFDRSGIVLYGSGNFVRGNYIGTNASGSAIPGNGLDGVRVYGANNRIGGTTPGDRNILSGNLYSGVGLYTTDATGNVVSGNYIGTNTSGTIPLGNHFRGVVIDEAVGNTIGGTDAGARNVISGNNGNGVEILDGATDNVVSGNYIGVNAPGTVALRNGANGVYITGNSVGNTIGGTVASAGNVISGNTDDGIWIQGLGLQTGTLIAGNYIGTNAAGTAAIGNGEAGVNIERAAGNYIGGTAVAARNVISGNGTDGVALGGAGAVANTVWGNYIGTNAAGTAAIANLDNGVVIADRAANNTIGGTVAGARNVISGNTHNGVRIVGGTMTAFNPHDNVVSGNYIGTNAAGTAALGNRNSGVQIFQSSDNTIGGSTISTRNVISGNVWAGVEIGGGNATENLVASNYIGTNAAGTAAVGNNFYGVLVDSAPDNTIGGFIGSRNVISGNGTGVVIRSNYSTGNLVSGNYIGTNAAGTAALGNRSSGVLVESQGNTIGGSGFGASNVISGNIGDGVRLLYFTASLNTISGNYIGTNVSGTGAIGNGGNGVFVSNGMNNMIGGTTSAARNVVAFNGGDGVSITGGATGNAIIGNSIRSNGDLGIDLGPNGATANDQDDIDSGANNLQNHPVLISGVNGPGTFMITGTFNSVPSSSFMLQYFASAADPAGASEGDRLLGSLTVVTDAGGDVRLPNGDTIFTATFATSVPAGQMITATATRLGAVYSDTSEFSPAVPVTAITGRKFHDLDADGIADPGESGLAGWTIYLDANGDNQLNPGEASTVTDANGNYVLAALAGTNVVREVMRPGWFQSAPVGGEHTVNVTAGLYVGRDFGNYRHGTISGLKFHDLDGNGVRGANEPTLAGWTIYIDSNNNGALDVGEPTEITDAAGTYEFNQLTPGTYRLREVLQPGWQQSAPQASFYMVTLTSDQHVTGRDFGNYMTGAITGTVYHDFDADGVRDGNEPGMGNWTVYLDADNDGVFDPGEAFRQTDPAGRYSFLGLRPGTYVVREVGLPGWRQTAPVAGAHVVTLTSGSGFTNRDFGNTRRDPQLFIILSPASVSEGAGAGAVMATVIRSGASTTAPLAVSLSSSDTAEAQVPATVVIPAGQSSATFFITAVDDLLWDGDQSVVISATAVPFLGGSATLLVTDDEA